MSRVILIYGQSGAGKTTSCRNLDPKSTLYIDCDGKGLSWQGWRKSFNAANKNYVRTTKIKSKMNLRSPAMSSSTLTISTFRSEEVIIMAYPFSLARGITSDFKRQRVEGVFDHITNKIQLRSKSTGYKLVDVDFQSLRFNTGFIDAGGNEIFEGDILETGDAVTEDYHGFFVINFDRETGIWMLYPQEGLYSLTQRIASASYVNNGNETWQKYLEEDKNK